MSFEYGFKRAVGEVVTGVVSSVIVDAFLSSGSIPPTSAILFGIMNMSGDVILLLAMPFWGTVYLFGWLAGLIIMMQAGLIGIPEAVFFFVIPLMILFFRVYEKLK